MDPNLAWRAIEEPEAPPPAGPPPQEPARARRMPLVAGILAGGAGLALGVALLGGDRTPPLIVDGETAGPRGSAAAAVVSRMAPSMTPPLVVDISGAVARPGLYRLPEGARVADAIEAAGGFGPRVDAVAAGRLNLAALVKDGEQVLVPSRDDPVAGAPATTAGAGAGAGAGGAGAGPVDLNHATEAELDALPGIGPATAKKIIASREEALFASVDDLRGRKLVGEAMFAKLAGLVTAGP